MKYAWINVKRRKTSAALAVIITAIVVFICFILLTVFMTSRKGMELSEKKMGADLVIYPDTAEANGKNIVFTGIREMVYMDEQAVLDALPKDKVSEVTSQFFLQTLPGSGCCDVQQSYRIVGVKPGDFLLKEWMDSAKIDALKKNEMIIGSNIEKTVGEPLSILNYQYTVVGKLDPTGTGMDDSVFVEIENLKKIGSRIYAPNNFGNQDINKIVSSVFVMLKDDVSEEDFLNTFDKSAVGASVETVDAMRDEIKKQNSLVSWFLTCSGIAVLILAVIGLIVLFNNWVTRRKKEIGYLKTIGYTKKQISSQLLTEVLIQSLTGSVIGAIPAILLYPKIIGFLKDLFVMPTSTLGAGTTALLTIAVILFAIVISIAAALPVILRYAGMDPYEAVAEGELE